MWFYLFSKDERFPDPLAEIRALAALYEAGGAAYLKLSARDDAPLKNAEAGETAYLCTREQGRWLAHGEAILTGPASHGDTPPSVASIYGPSPARRWWRRLGRVDLYSAPRCEADLGLAEGTLPRTGQAHVVHIPLTGHTTINGRTPEPPDRPLDRLTNALDEAWDAGRLTPEAIDDAVQRFRTAHPYGR